MQKIYTIFNTIKLINIYLIIYYAICMCVYVYVYIYTYILSKF